MRERVGRMEGRERRPSRNKSHFILVVTELMKLDERVDLRRH